jgi:Fic family protein
MTELKLYSDLSSMEPLFPEGDITHLESLADEFLLEAKKLEGSLHSLTRMAIVNMLRPMNSYYSNLIEGHDTSPIDIEKALNNTYSTNKEKRNLQIEAHAHIRTHEFISEKIIANEYSISDEDFIKRIHFEFYKNLPAEFLKTESKDGIIRDVIPGEYRTVEVQVGNHVAPANDRVLNFMERFNASYKKHFSSNNRLHRVIAIAAAHHRLAWIHPFLDGNGRVVRLFSDACFINETLHADGLWSISRGLARSNNKYKEMLSNADSHRINDYDGHGNLSNKYLIEFIDYFLSVAIDQVKYMSEVLNLETLYNRIEKLCDLLITKNVIREEAKYILLDVFSKGKLSKKDAMRITNLSDKTLKLITDKLLELQLIHIDKIGVMVHYYPKYPARFSPYLFPGLYPTTKEAELIELAN